MDSYLYYCSVCNKLFKVSGSGKRVKCSKCNHFLFDMEITSDAYASLSSDEKESLKSKFKVQEKSSDPETEKDQQTEINQEPNEQAAGTAADELSESGSGTAEEEAASSANSDAIAEASSKQDDGANTEVLPEPEQRIESDSEITVSTDTSSEAIQNSIIEESNTSEHIETEKVESALQKNTRKKNKKIDNTTEEIQDKKETEDKSEIMEINKPVIRRNIKVSIDYNPYLMEYYVLFNGKEPRINSAVEKYNMYPLQMWVNEVPRILYDEMNGYDFDLEFTGPEMDYRDLEKAFTDAGVTEEDVQCIHKKKLEPRTEKLRDIYELISWLEENPNKRLDYETFKMESPEAFENDYPIIIVGEKCPGDFVFENANVSIEVISDIKELNNITLKNTPIIFETGKLYGRSARDLLLKVIRNEDVMEEQHFFYVSPNENVDMAYRLIQDLGIKKPIVIKDMLDYRLGKFFEYYPISEHIRSFLKTMRTKIEDVKDCLNEEKEESDKINGAIIEDIAKIEEHINVVKESIAKLNDIANTNISVNWGNENDTLLQKISSWKSRKTQITNDDEAIRLSEQYEEEIKYHWNSYIENIKNITLENKEALLLECSEAYYQAIGVRDNQEVYANEQDSETYVFDDIKNELIKIKDERYEKPKEGLLNAILGNTEPKEEVLVTTYPCQRWREYVTDMIIPLMNKKTGERDSELDDYCKTVVDKYVGKLTFLLKNRIKEKEEISEQLSEDIQLLQKDIDWLNEFSDRLESIERD